MLVYIHGTLMPGKVMHEKKVEQGYICIFLLVFMIMCQQYGHFKKLNCRRIGKGIESDQ